MNPAQLKCILVFSLFAIIGFGPISPGCLIGMYIVVKRPRWFIDLTDNLYIDRSKWFFDSLSLLEDNIADPQYIPKIVVMEKIVRIAVNYIYNQSVEIQNKDDVRYL